MTCLKAQALTRRKGALLQPGTAASAAVPWAQHKTRAGAVEAGAVEAGAVVEAGAADGGQQLSCCQKSDRLQPHPRCCLLLL